MDGLGPRYDPDALIAAQVRTDRLHQLFHQSVTAIPGSVLAAIMLCLLCWERFDHHVIFWWMGILTASTSLRVAMFIA